MKPTKYKIPTYEEYADILTECLFVEDIESVKNHTPELYVTKSEAWYIIHQMIKNVEDPSYVTRSYYQTSSKKCIRVNYSRSIKYKGRVIINIEAHMGNFYPVIDRGPRPIDAKRRIPNIHNKVELSLDYYFDEDLYQTNLRKRPGLSVSIDEKETVTRELLDEAREASIGIGKGRYFYRNGISLCYDRPSETEKEVILFWPHDTLYVARY